MTGTTGILGRTVGRTGWRRAAAVALVCAGLTANVGAAPAAALDGIPTPDAIETPAAYAPKGGGSAPADPFEPLIEPPLPVAPAPQPAPAADERRAVLPLPLALVAVVGNDGRRLALLELNGATYEMSAGEAEPGGLFTLVEVREASVTVHDSRVRKNRVIELK